MSREIVEIESDSDADTPWKDSLRECLDGVLSSGQIASFHHNPRYVNPGLKIGDRSIPLPLTERDAQYIRGECRKAPYGMSDETVVDTSARKAWELDQDKFTLTNPHWPSFFDELIKEAARNISLNSPTVKPHKLLLYEPGSFLNPHKDSEKEMGMVGTLVVNLPSKHTGADIHLSFGSEKRIIVTAPTSEHGISTLAWFSDVTHEVKELTSGYQLVLIYNLIQNQGNLVTPTAAMQVTIRLKQLLLDWKHQQPNLDKLIYPLTHTYTPANLCLQNMKGRDFEVSRLLHHLSSETGLFMLLAQMSREVTGDYDYDDYEEDTRFLRTVVSPGGGLVADCVDLCTQSEVLGGEAIYENRDPDEEVDSEAMGIEGSPLIHRYHDSVLVLVRKEGLKRLITQSHSFSRLNEEPAIINALAMFSQDLEKAETDPAAGTVALDFMNMVVRENVSGNCGLPLISAIAGWALKFEDRTLFGNVMTMAQDHPLYQLELGAQFAAYAQLKSEDGVPFDWDKHLPFVPQDVGILVFNQNMRTFTQFIDRPELKLSFIEWQKRVLERMIVSQTEWDFKEVPAVNSLIEEYQNDADWLLEKLFPTIVRGGTQRLLFKVLHKLSANLARRRSVEKARAMCEYVLVHGRATLMLQASDMLLSRPSNPTGDGNALLEFVRILEDGYSQGAEDEVDKFLDATFTGLMSTSSSWMPEIHGMTILKGFLAPLAKTFNQLKVKSIPSVKDFFEVCLRQNFAQIPTKLEAYLPGWSYPTRGCPFSDQRWYCPDCIAFNQFLASPDEQQWEFRGVSGRRAHIEQGLQPDLFACGTIFGEDPPCLVVTKRVTTYARAKANLDWQVKQVKNALDPLKIPYMANLLGPVNFRDLVMLRGPVSQQTSQGIEVGRSELRRVNVEEGQPVTAIAENIQSTATKREVEDGEIPASKWRRME